MKAGYVKKTITPIKKWKTNYSQQISEYLITCNHEPRLIKYTGHWDGLQFDSAIYWLHKDDIEGLKKYLSIN